MTVRLASVCAAVCVAAMAALPAQEREDRTLLSSEQMRAIINEASGERAMHHVLELVPYQRVRPVSEYQGHLRESEVMARFAKDYGYSNVQIETFPQIPSIQSWRGNPYETSERGSDSAEPHIRGIRDSKGRVMVLMTHNTDISDAWEREAEDPRYFYSFSPSGYAVGINVMIYAMTH